MISLPSAAAWFWELRVLEEVWEDEPSDRYGVLNQHKNQDSHGKSPSFLITYKMPDFPLLLLMVQTSQTTTQHV